MPIRPETARAKLVAHLTQLVLDRNSEESYALPSEHELCRQFDLSRVTIRLALGDLENRGLIYRRHGKGTFAHGRSTRQYRNIGVLLRSISSENRSVAELIRGMQSVQMELGAGVMLIGARPSEWRPEMAGILSGVAVLPCDLRDEDLAVLRDRNLPSLLVGDSPLSGPRIIMGQRAAGRVLTERLLALGHRSFAILSGPNGGLDEPKRLGVNEALRAAGIDPAGIPESVADEKEVPPLNAARSLLEARPRPTAIISFEDSLAGMLSYVARRLMGLSIPGDLSIVSFHEWPYLAEVEPALCTVRFDFFSAGREAAKAINHAARTGTEVATLSFEPAYIEGQTVGAAPAKE